MIDSNKIGNQLKAFRKAKNFTTQDLAEKVNVSQSYISRFENGRAVPDIDMLEKILAALGTNLASFFSDDREELPDDLLQLIDTVKTLSPEARVKLNEFLILMKNGEYED
ncbi:helix-turn-helix domain-containing protein [Lentibacillus sp. CBA3610]|uniref:helix-turn-helix domain-containing protein n=1 Tax=Lentibacillus sp. CBA3610 TaxID=2518176 RepID=UPI0015956A50|nr:helix-turn-helix transcriptional regulator [Lentibacillus sp. CBA3610]QKY70279.1 helix-turn-helix domain-containing protein [Lentibacillus sp. CBA3610]